MRKKLTEKQRKENRRKAVSKSNKKRRDKKMEWHYFRYFGMLLSREKCEKCGKKKKLVVHHKDRTSIRRDGYANNDAKNLQVLCRSCHLNEHREEIRKNL